MEKIPKVERVDPWPAPPPSKMIGALLQGFGVVNDAHHLFQIGVLTEGEYRTVVNAFRADMGYEPLPEQWRPPRFPWRVDR